MKCKKFFLVLLLAFYDIVYVCPQSHQPSNELKQQSQLDFGPIREQLNNSQNRSTTRPTTTHDPYPNESSSSMDGKETNDYELICFMAEILEERSNLLFSLENSDEMDLLTNLLTGERSRTGHKLGKFFIPRVG